RRMMVTSMVFATVLVLFLWMVRTVIIAAILGVIVATYSRPLYLRILRPLRVPLIAAGVTLGMLILPIVALSFYSYREISDRAAYIDSHKDEISNRIDASLRRVPFLRDATTTDAVKHYVVVASNYGTTLLSGLRSALASLAVA